MPVVSHHEVVTPASLAEALAFLSERAGEGWQPFAGGTDLMVHFNYGQETASRWVDLSRLRGELASIDDEGELVRIGGMATMTELRHSTLLSRACPMIGAAASTVGAIQIQNRATVAGNIANASPAGDTLPVWLALDAEIELASSSGRRVVPYRDFTPAYRKTVRRSDELVTAVLFRSPPAECRQVFRKVGTRAAQAISKVVMAAIAAPATGPYEDVRLAFGSMGPVPTRVPAAEAAARGRPVSSDTGERAAAALATDLAPIDDVRSTAEYRMHVAGNLVRAFLAGYLG